MNESAKEFGKLLLASIIIPVTVQILSQLALAWQQKLWEAQAIDTDVR